MKKKIVTTLCAVAFIFGFLFPNNQTQNPIGGASTYAIIEDIYSNF